MLAEHLEASVGTDPAVVLAGLPNLIEGVDLDPNALWVANVVLAAEMLPWLALVPARRRRRLPALCRVGYGLAPAQRRARVVLMNPPYARVKLSDGERERFAHALYGHANLYGLFMAAALDQLADDGVLAALVPTSWTSGSYFRNLRSTLSSQAPLQDVTFVVERGGVFDDVLQETCLAVFSGRRRRTTTIASPNGHVASVGKVARPSGAGPWLLPRRSDDAVIAAAAAEMPHTLNSAGWGVSTGPLVWNRRSTDLYPRAARSRVPVTWAADIDGGELHRDQARDGMRYLHLRGCDAEVLVLDEPALLVQRTTAPEQARRIVGAALNAATLKSWGGRVVVENHVNVLRSTALAPLMSHDLLGRVLGSPTIDRLARCLSGSVATSAFELEALPLPDASALPSSRPPERIHRVKSLYEQMYIYDVGMNRKPSGRSLGGTMGVKASARSLDRCDIPVVDGDLVRSVRLAMPDENWLESVTQIFGLLSDPHRMKLMAALLEAEEMCVCDLAAACGTSESSVSHALRLMRACGVVRVRRSGRRAYYSLADAHLRVLLDVSLEHIAHTRHEVNTR